MKSIQDLLKNAEYFFLILLACRVLVSNSSQCNEYHIVASCPSARYQWTSQARDKCVQENKYHCLITENHNEDHPQYIECCMPSQNISRGYMPRYNTVKGELQEIECEKDYYMPTSFESSRFRENGVAHCKYKKGGCDSEGMKIFDNGSKTENRHCFCDYKKNYKPELPISDNKTYFDEKDNRCILDPCSQNKELNMLYSCVQVCEDGKYRPVMEMECISISLSTRSTEGTTDDARISRKTTQKPETTTTIQDMIKPENTTDNYTSIIIPVIVVVCCLVIMLIVVTVFLIKSGRKMFIYGNVHYGRSINTVVNQGEQESRSEDTQLIPIIPIVNQGEQESRSEDTQLIPIIPNPTVEVPNIEYSTEVCSTVTLEVKVSFEDSSEDLNVEWIFKDKEISSDSKFTVGEMPSPSLKITNIDLSDSGTYIFNVLHNNDKIRRIITLNVKEPRITLKNNKEFVEMGKDAVIECEILAAPEHELKWVKVSDSQEEEEELRTSEKQSAKYRWRKKFPHLIISEADMEDKAYYYCYFMYTTSVKEHKVESGHTYLQILDGKTVNKFIETNIEKVDRMISGHKELNINMIDEEIKSEEEDDTKSNESKEDTSRSDQPSLKSKKKASSKSHVTEV